MGRGLENLGHMTKMVTMPIYGKNPLKIFSETKRPMTLGLGMQSWGHGPNNKSKDDLDLFYGKVNFFYIDFYRQNIKHLLI